VQFHILGPLEVVGDDGVPIPITAPKQRTLLIFLLLRAGTAVSVDRIVDAVWDAHPPTTVEDSLANLLSRLRAALGGGRFLKAPRAHGLQAAADEVDATRFEQLVAGARGLEPEARSRQLAAALALWRGPALADVAYEEFALAESLRLEALRLDALEERIAADLERGLGSELATELELLVGEEPRKERLRGYLMLALYRAGRQAEAVQAYQDARRALAEIGLDPSPALRDIYRSILRQEDVLLPARALEPDDQLEAVVEALARGRLVIVLGNDTAGAAERLARRFACPPEYAGELARVAQYVSLTHGQGPLYDELYDAHDGSEPGAVERSLARIAAAVEARGQPPLLLLTTSFDETLEQALRDASVTADVVAYLASGPHRGRFVHIAHDGEPRVIAVPNAYTALEPGRTVVLKLHGAVDRISERRWESYAVSEDDHIDYLAQADVANLVPVTVAARLQRSHLLFIGYSLRQWSLRVFLHRVFGRDRLAYRSWAVMPVLDDVERRLLEARGIDPVVAAPEGVAEALAARVDDGAP
jgi:DNA-binding SARP family transcriptional activator